VQYVSRGTYRLFNKTQSRSHLPFIYFELPSDASLLRNSGVYDATTVRDDNTLRADLVRLDVNTWVLHVAGELLRCPGSIFYISRDYFDSKLKHRFLSRVSTLTRDIDIAYLSVRPSVCPSVRDVPVLDENGLTYRHSFFRRTVAQSF